MTVRQLLRRCRSRSMAAAVLGFAMLAPGGAAGPAKAQANPYCYDPYYDPHYCAYYSGYFAAAYPYYSYPAYSHPAVPFGVTLGFGDDRGGHRHRRGNHRGGHGDHHR